MIGSEGKGESQQAVSPVPASIPSAAVCAWCRKTRRVAFYRGRRAARCSCFQDYRNPVERRRDAVLDKYGDDPANYTPAVLKRIAKQGLFDITTAFCPAGRLTLAQAKAREASAIEAATAGETHSGSTEGESAGRQGDAR